jgi:hypothetical protein
MPTPNAQTPPARRRATAGIAAAVAVAGLAVAGCGSSASPTILNSERVERAIERSSLTQRHIHTQVTCPSGVHQQKGLGFDCTALVGTGSARFSVTQLDDSGHVSFLGH